MIQKDRIELLLEKILIELKNRPTKEEMERRFEQFGYDLDDKLMQLRSDFYSKVDPFLKEIETARIDREVSSYQLTKVQTKLTNHEQRITKLEDKAKN